MKEPRKEPNHQEIVEQGEKSRQLRSRVAAWQGSTRFVDAMDEMVKSLASQPPGNERTIIGAMLLADLHSNKKSLRALAEWLHEGSPDMIPVAESEHPMPPDLKEAMEGFINYMDLTSRNAVEAQPEGQGRVRAYHAWFNEKTHTVDDAVMLALEALRHFDDPKSRGNIRD